MMYYIKILLWINAVSELNLIKKGVFKYLWHANFKLYYMYYFQCKTAMDIILIKSNIFI